ncbi:MAG: DUF3179 domain-containing protein [Gemmatimonadales bacterium]
MCTRSLALLAAALSAVGCDSPVGGELAPSNCDLPSPHLYSGGPPPDGIPALNDPDAVPAAHAAYRDEDRVLGVERNGAFRAYPLLVLWWHEIVNDTLGGAEILVTYCPLTGSGLAFDPDLGDAQRTLFGVSGLLFENNLIMFDRATKSLWPQLMLSARCGSRQGTALPRLPVIETTWGAWRAAHPGTTVITTNTGHSRSYGAYPYGDYDTPTNRDLLFPSAGFSNARPPKELVLGAWEGAAAVAYPFGYLDSLGVALVAINDTVGARPVLVTYQRAARTGLAFDRVAGGDTLEFRVATGDPALLEDLATQSQWTPWGEAVSGPLAGTRLALLTDAYPVFWFAWWIFNPETRIYRGMGGSGLGARVQARK